MISLSEPVSPYLFPFFEYGRSPLLIHSLLLHHSFLQSLGLQAPQMLVFLHNTPSFVCLYCHSFIYIFLLDKSVLFYLHTPNDQTTGNGKIVSSSLSVSSPESSSVEHKLQSLISIHRSRCVLRREGGAAAAQISSAFILNMRKLNAHSKFKCITRSRLCRRAKIATRTKREVSCTCAYIYIYILIV